MKNLTTLSSQHRKREQLISLLAVAYLTFFILCSQHVLGQIKALPPTGKTLMFVGQDFASVQQYQNSNLFPTPSGIVSYMPLPELQGLWQNFDWGAGTINTLQSAQAFPNSLLAMGIYMKDDEWRPNRLGQIANGDFDDEIIEFATFLGTKCKYLNSNGDSASYPVYLRLGYEFEGSWNNYHPQRYINAYKHIVDVIRPIAPNTIFVWHAATSPVDHLSDIQNGITKNLEDWYPGDDYVDWMGISWFLSADPLQATQSNKLLNLARKKGVPVMICESTPQGYDLAASTKRFIGATYDGTPGQGMQVKTADEIWNEWYVPYFNYIYNNADVIRAACYINANWDTQALWGPDYSGGYWGDSRIEANTTITQKWNEEMAKSTWMHGGEGFLEQIINRDEVILNLDEESDGKIPVVYPNPAQDSITVIGAKAHWAYKIFNLKGESISHGSGNMIPVSQLENGMYLLQYDEIPSKQFKIVIKH